MFKAVFFLTVLNLCLSLVGLILEPSFLGLGGVTGWVSASCGWFIIMRELKNV